MRHPATQAIPSPTRERDDRLCRFAGEEVGEHVRHDPAGDLAAFVSAHPVRDQIEAEVLPDPEGILVVLASTDVTLTKGRHGHFRFS